MIIRFTAAGDIVMANPVASAIKHMYPDTQVTWIVHAKYQALISDHPAIDQVIPIDLDLWQSLWRKGKLKSLMTLVLALRERLKPCAVDKVIDLQSNGTSGFIAWLSQATHRIALGSEGTNNWFTTKTISKNLGEQIHIGSEYRYLVNQLGYSDNPWRMHLPQTTRATDAAANILSEALGDAPFAVICPVSRWEQKHWPLDHWVQFILRIRGRYQLRTVIIGDDDQHRQAEQIAQKSGALNLCDKLTVDVSAAIIQKAALVVGIDTGYTHMGHAAAVPTVSLFGATYPYAYVENETSKILYLDRFCSPCRKHPTCKKLYPCMSEITPDKVLTTIKPLMIKNNSDRLIVQTN